ncbi:MAG: HEAT repeat domain-containing protein [Candidatus Omnitrophica bacterium]|nr:HEAT repeat domain-containing protein [Candidatus Omnitrophota bacterium]
MVSLITFFLLSSTGCVKRTIVIESNPPGAKVWINEHPAGTTPVSHEFITHGRYKFRLDKPGFRELTVREMVRAPIYQWIPLDLFFEHLLPFHLEDRHAFRYSLTPESPKERLGKTPAFELPQIEADLRSPDPEKRRQACFLLAGRRDPATAQEVLQATRDPIPTVRSSALSAWRAIRQAESLDRLEEALRLDPDDNVRWQAAIEMEALASPKAVPALIGALKDKKPLVRIGAAEALNGIPDPKALDPLIAALRDRESPVRRAAAQALGKIGDRKAVRPLTRALRHHDFQTRRKAVEALRGLKDPACGPALVRTFTDWDPKIRDTATLALIEFGDERVVPPLIRSLKGWKPWTREHAARALGGLKNPRAIEPLKRALLREPNPTAYAAMSEALVALGVAIEKSWIRTFAPPKEDELKGKKDWREGTS